MSAVIYHHGLASRHRCRGELTTNHLPYPRQRQSIYTYIRNHQTNETLLTSWRRELFFIILNRVLNASAGKNTIHIIEHWIKVRMDILNNFIFIRKKCITSTFILVKKTAYFLKTNIKWSPRLTFGTDCWDVHFTEASYLVCTNLLLYPLL